jgi:glycosyltransferase involved in cell wall biosynthesis
VRLARIVHREQIDVVNVHYFSNHWIYLFLLWRLLRFRLVVSVHGTDIQGPDGSENVKALEEWLPAIDAVVFCSETARQGIRPASTLFKKTVVILNAIDLSSLPAPLGDTERSPYLICSGHLQRHKGQDILIRAFCILAAEFPEICLEIVGDGPTRPELEALVGELRLQSRVHFHGGLPREKSIEVMKSATLTCVPSRRETFGLVLLESMALGVSIVASRVGGIPEVVREQVDAILVTPENVQELATALTHVLRQRELRLFLIANAKARVGEMFTAERLVTNYRELFQRVMSEKGAGAGI